MSNEVAASVEARVSDSPSPLLGLNLHPSTGRNFALRLGSCFGKNHNFKFTPICNMKINMKMINNTTSFLQIIHIAAESV